MEPEKSDPPADEPTAPINLSKPEDASKNQTNLGKSSIGTLSNDAHRINEIKNQIAQSMIRETSNERMSTINLKFQPEASKLHKVQLNNYHQGSVNDKNNFLKKEREEKLSIFKSLRFYVMLITMLSPIVSTYSKNAINFTVLRMIDPEYKNVDTTRNLINGSIPYFDLDNSCPVNGFNRERLLEDLRVDKRTSSQIGEKFKWDAQQQGWLKAAYSIGHIPFQITGSRLSERYSAHRVLTFSILFTGIFSLLVPYSVSGFVTSIIPNYTDKIGYYLLFTDLLLLGIVGSFVTPSLMTLFSNWLTPGEKAIMLPCYLITSRIGSTITSLLCGFILDKRISWKYIFYIGGLANMFFVFLFTIFATGKPVEHRLISEEELKYLARKNLLVSESMAKKKREKKEEKMIQLETIGDLSTGTIDKPGLSQLTNSTNGLSSTIKPKTEKWKKNPPWGAILTSVPVWSFVITKFCVKLSGDLGAIELPAYLDRVMHYTTKENGTINAFTYTLFCVGSFVGGALSKWAVKRRPFNLSKTSIRKIFQSFASFGVASMAFGMAFGICESWPTISFLLLWNFMTTFGTGGEQQIPFDITERYSGTIHAIASSLAFSGVVVPVAVGRFLKDNPADRDKWRIIWYAASAVAATGGLVFLFGADARVQPFDSMNVDSNDDDNDDNGKKDNGNRDNNK